MDFVVGQTVQSESWSDMELFRSVGELDGHHGLEEAFELGNAEALETFSQSFSLHLRSPSRH